MMNTAMCILVVWKKSDSRRTLYLTELFGENWRNKGENKMIKCELCEKTNFQTATEKYYVFDAYCVSCRGLFNYFVRVKRQAETFVRNYLKETYRDKRK